MIKIFYGENRLAAEKEIKKLLGNEYEVIEGEDLSPNSLPNIFQGQTFFSTNRNILIRDLSSNKSVFNKLPEYLDTPHRIIIFESKLDKRLTAYKILKDKLEIKEFKLPYDPNKNQVFNIYNVAKKDGKKAIKMLEDIKHTEDPIRFFGLLVSGALKDYDKKQGIKEKKALKELSHLDIELKSSKLSSWLLLESFLLRLSSL